MKTLTDFRKTVETGVDPRLIVIVSFNKQTNAAKPKTKENTKTLTTTFKK